MPGISPSLHTIDIDSIIINRDVRQRTEIDDLSGLIQDISIRGLLNPIIISKKDKRLIAGERRLTSYRTLFLSWQGGASGCNGFVNVNIAFAAQMINNIERGHFISTSRLGLSVALSRMPLYLSLGQ